MPDPAATAAAETRALLEQTGALLTGHFILRSGLRSPHYVQCARLGEHLDAVTRLAALLLARLADHPFATVLAPAMGGLVLGQELARQARARYLFAEKENDVLVLRRGFVLAPGERVLVAEDVVTRGGRAMECVEIIRRAGAIPVAVAMIVDRSAGQAPFPCPAVSLIQLDIPAYPADQLPPELAALPAVKPGS